MQDSKQYQVILADDDCVGRVKGGKILELGGFGVYLVSSGAEAIKLAKEVHPDLIVLDVMMGDLNGFETSELLKNDEATYDIPIIFLTGLDNRFSIIKALRAGAVDYIIKPVEQKDLIAKVTAALHVKNLAMDKINLLKINQAMVEQVKTMLSELGIISRVNQMKEDLESNSLSALDQLAEVRSSIENYNEDEALAAISSAESSLQFSDRVSQQLNELAKVFTQIHDTLTNEKTALMSAESKEVLDRSSTDSVLGDKIDQSAVDDLLNSLDI